MTLNHLQWVRAVLLGIGLKVFIQDATEAECPFT